MSILFIVGKVIKSNQFIMEEKMKFKSPMKITWIIAVILGVLGTLPLLGIDVPVVGKYQIVMLVAAWVLLALATVVKGL
jgi:hypothetical protein